MPADNVFAGAFKPASGRSRAISFKNHDRARLAWWLAIALYAVGFLFYVNSTFTDRQNQDDAWQNALSAWNLYAHGTFSAGGTVPPVPDNVREPLPPFLLALQMHLDPRFAGAQSFRDLQEGAPLRALKQHNLVWVLAGQLLVALLTFRVLNPAVGFHARFVAAFAAMAGTGLFLFTSWPYVDRTMTEVQGATLLTLACLLTLSALEGKSAWRFGALGLALGACALTKASTLYVSAVFLLVLLGFLAMRRDLPWKDLLLRVGAAVLGVALVVTPWVARNRIALGEMEMAERGGGVLYLRAVEDRMTPLEWKGAFYVYAPAALKPAIGALLGFSRKDLQKGGRLARLNREGSDFMAADRAAKAEGRPEDATSYYAIGSAEQMRLRKEFEAQGLPDAKNRADAALQDKALGEIAAHPLRHLKASVVILWKGIFSLRSPIFWLNAAAALGGVAALFWLSVRSLVTLNERDFAVAVLPAGTIAFYALATHFIDRYSAPLIPMMMAALARVLCGRGWTLFRRPKPDAAGLQDARHETGAAGAH